ncbi:MAG: hypothetical protein ACP5OO_04365 [Chloroflexia bacterium]
MSEITATEVRTRARRHDRWVSWIVIGVFLLALAVGALLKTLAETRTVEYPGDGFRLNYPAGWVRQTGLQPPYLFQVEDLGATPTRTTITLQRRPLPQHDPLGVVQRDLTIERRSDGLHWAGYRELSLESNARLDGREALHTTFAYVEMEPNPFQSSLPVVMHGEDYFFLGKTGVYIFTLTAAEENYAQDQGLFLALVRSFREE